MSSIGIHSSEDDRGSEGGGSMNVRCLAAWPQFSWARRVKSGTCIHRRESGIAVCGGSIECSTSDSRDLVSAFDALKVGGEESAPQQLLFSARLDAVQDTATGVIPSFRTHISW